ncbi:right-handed parallel beta-helix repeat-containing protein [Lysinibacter sp. HNR]|uniref:right-handed parallel beta-helix repeat-containing protein n=1 Tax=Lysinibacter sp. HNR TaxID=3031408 RepID=UPI0024352D78|nr:right-handed parallel beta-helix repeat-containing protein [Lysinibacter sp. HNR]WGD36363.1 right-handed parallel beta-helix repeat-containing protein [Lysinibacter sp. HNR]
MLNNIGWRTRSVIALMVAGSAFTAANMPLSAVAAPFEQRQTTEASQTPWLGATSCSSSPDLQSATVAGSWAELRAAVNSGAPLIHIPGNAEITVPNEPNALRIKRNQQLVGDRCESRAGASLKIEAGNIHGKTYPVITMDSNARIEGLRILGPYHDPSAGFRILGVQTVSGSSGQIIRNSELAGWSYSALSIKTTTNVLVENNYIHDNFLVESNGYATGYGVVVQNGNATATIRRNVFDRNRHAIAGSGQVGEGYTATENLVLQGGGKQAYHQFDMHAGTGTTVGGEYVDITNNFFDYGRVGTSNRQSVLVRGVPASGPAEVKGNFFSQDFFVGSQVAVGGGAAVPSQEQLRLENQFKRPFKYAKTDECLTFTVDKIRWCLPDSVPSTP